MNATEAKVRVEKIRETWDDIEMRHIYEDELLVDVLKEIAAGTLTGEEAREIAAIALEPQEFIDIRWYA